MQIQIIWLSLVIIYGDKGLFKFNRKGRKDRFSPLMGGKSGFFYDVFHLVILNFLELLDVIAQRLVGVEVESVLGLEAALLSFFIVRKL